MDYNFSYPLLDETSKTTEWPEKPVCPICGAAFRDTGWLWLNAGALQVDKKGDGVYDKRLKPHMAYFDIGVHGIPVPMTEHDIEEEFLVLKIVEFVHGEDFDLCFCSIQCLRKWLDLVLSDFETMFEEKYGRKLSQLKERAKSDKW